jgi:hypothetical protein
MTSEDRIGNIKTKWFYTSRQEKIDEMGENLVDDVEWLITELESVKASKAKILKSLGSYE